MANIRSAILALLIGVPGLVNAAVSDVIVWNTLRTTTQMTTTRDNGYSSMTNMRLWWKLNNANNLGLDSTSNGRHAKINGVVQGLTMPDQFTGVSRIVATGFNTPDSFVVGNPGFTDGKTADRTYEFWIRNPAKNDSVFFSITQSETGLYKAGDEDDLIRMWINPNGSITVADRGLTPDSNGYYRLPDSQPLTWNNNQWYQMVVLFEDLGNGTHNVKVYRGSRANPVQLLQLFDYTAATYGTGTQHWLAIGGHSQTHPTYPPSYGRPRKNDVGKPGFLGCDGPGTAPTINLDSYTDGSGDDTYAWRKACAVISAYGQGTLQLTAGKIYVVGKETAGALADRPYYRADGLGLIAGARHGKITVNGNGATIKLKDGMHVGGFNPTTGLAEDWDSDEDPDDHLKVYRAQPGNLLTIERCLNVEIKNLTFDGNIQNQSYGGIYGNTGYQVAQHGIFLGGPDAAEANDEIWIHDVVSSYNTVDGVGITNHIEEDDPIKTVLIERVTCKYNGRQGLSYNCGNHLWVADSEFSHTGRLRANYPNSPACGIDVEPLGRYMAQGAIFENCNVYANRAYGIMLLDAPPCIIRDCTLWGTSNLALKIGTDNGTDVDHLILRSKIYGGYYSANARRIRFEDCLFVVAEQGDANSPYPGASISKQHGIEQVGDIGSTILSGCKIQALHPGWLDEYGEKKTRSGHAPSGVVLQNSEVTHGNWSAVQPTPAIAGLFQKSYFLNTTFRETNVFASNQDDIYYVNIGSGATLSAIGPGCRIEGATAGSPNYVRWGSSSGTQSGPIPPNITEGVLTPNAASGETQINTGATYTATPAFTNPADSTGMRLFNGDPVGGGWDNRCGINPSGVLPPAAPRWSDKVEQVVTIDLKLVRHVRSVKMIFQTGTQADKRPRRVYVYVGDGTTWEPLGLVRPQEGAYLAPWFDVTLPATVAGRYVRLEFENDGDWGWYINEIKVYGHN